MTVNEGELWSFFRKLISQGTYIQMDAHAGKYQSSEEVFRRIDEAARERVDEFLHGQQEPPLGMEAHSALETPVALKPSEEDTFFKVLRDSPRRVHRDDRSGASSGMTRPCHRCGKPIVCNRPEMIAATIVYCDVLCAD